jgi:hypothetical protein
VTKNIVLNLRAPTLSAPADSATATNVVYTITSTDTLDDKLILDIGSSNFTFGSVSVGSASKVGNTVECTGFTTNNPAVTIQFTAEATYSVTAKAVHIAGTYGTSANSSADSLLIQNTTYMAATGGTITTYGDYKYHVFTGSGTLAISTQGDAEFTLDYLIVGGGGSAGTSSGTGVSAGGGAGGYRVISSVAPPATGNHSVVVGAGGVDNNSIGYGTNGNVSSFNGSSSSGGGGGGGYRPTGSYKAGLNGASGGGAPHHDNNPGYTPGTGNSGGYSPVEGYAGGVGRGGSWGGGGGGATEVGLTAAENTPARGGDGSNSVAAWITAIAAGGGATYGSDSATASPGSGGGYFAGGGMGGNYNNGPGTGGDWSTPRRSKGGGGTGNKTSGYNSQEGGRANHGGGGGGGSTGSSTPTNGGPGGSGIVIIKYQYQN